ncbi:RNA polymerase III subunit Rpc25-domain-containing protein [Cantharellus anzutake]|uniref:RNA polymerase III subunit Rpc25-domain-containing protein n=1 Tax=Cantharellus anzutake TaxID=1750568 RepID=UPI0019077B51|nr:RNA polymerase III subunit Rpc25-domain-containing protein [Cantharellus anzutake]KAF8329381.1 RNA polymerase III subunit Rpc25-domain-containing protein [Cantharellus anzutake]
MFQLSILKDKISVAPASFGIPAEQAIIKELNKKYANRVIFDLGLAICVHDLINASEGVVHYGDGCFWYKVTFRLVVFRPFSGEILIAKVKSSSSEGIRLTLGFFDDMIIPPSYLPSPSAFDAEEQHFFWNPTAEGVSSLELLDTPVSERNYIETGKSDEFHDDEPGPPKMIDGVISTKEGRRAPYTVIGSIAEQGLGLLSWWENDEEEEGVPDGGAIMDLDAA